MKEWFDKILVERPRVGGCGKERIRQNRRAAKADPENAMQFRSMTKIHSSKGYDDRKELNENLKPLRRFLRSRLGKPWNNVYSEIMAGLNLNNAVQYHVWQHLIKLGEVETNTFMQGNTVMIGSGGEPRPVGSYSWQDEFYVHPKTGLLCVELKQPSITRKNRIKDNWDANRYIDESNPLIQYHKINNLWYEIKLRPATKEEKAKGTFGSWVEVWNNKIGRYINEWRSISSNSLAEQIIGTKTYYWKADQWLWGDCTRVFGGNYLPIVGSKRQISSKEISRIEALMQQRDRRKKAA